MAAILVAAFYLKQHLDATVLPPVSSEAAVPAPAAISNVEVSVAEKPAILMVSNAPVAASPLTPEQRQAAIDAEIERLHQLFRSNDPAALPLILADLNNPEKEIRDAAIEAAKQFGSKDAIPALKAAANNTDDLAEKIDLLKAAEFLTLPTMNVTNPYVDLTPELIRPRLINTTAGIRKEPMSTNSVSGN